MTPETPVRESEMTEITLALAMGFWSVMVLTINSMVSGLATVGHKIENIVIDVPVDRAKRTHRSENLGT